ncbi:helix-turn-helix domain-containing protein [Kitasatospora sp. NPDC001175]|uniref:helix-turn-helix domain-containing protein n=1 Tax=Kitasatospora sp. NPDC001175 TaxID=3157103 RepID=UPI003CFFADC7
MPHYRLSREAVREAAKAKGDHTNRLISDRTGLHEVTLSNLLSGRRSPSLDAVMRVAKAYGVTADALLVQVA